MKKIDLQNLLSQPYKPENWKQIVQFVFPNVSILSSPKEFLINNEKIKKFRQIGNVRLNDGKNLALFELLLNDTVNIHRNRVELNHEISKYIDQEQIHGVLSVFEQGTDDYRFTFSARSTEFDEEESDFVQKKTDTKRYTYVLGKNESCKTPADRFYKLSENKSKTDINAVQNAFSVEQLSKEFFDKYKKQFEKFWKYIDSKKEEYKSLFVNGQGEREVKIRNFTKKLLGRIVFLHFLQKKGWMGCPENDLWGSGDKKFMQTLFKDFTNKDQFHSKCLVELFYNTLNTKRDDYLFKCEGLEGVLNNSKVPYLNGGLFDSDKLESTKIDFPESYFQDLFDFFDQYNFTIDENDPNDREVGIDPEMLGHIFENLLEDNKDKGAFYTPKVIVQYMCQESLIEYLAIKLEAETSDEVKQAIEYLIRNRLAEDISDLDLVEPIAQALFNVKICDPAIGSGAFPMGILNVIYQVIEALYYLQPDSVAKVWNISNTEWQPQLVKKNIIQHSIYGVDIESGAVDIARLRFWLTLVVDEVEPLPLPNLDYKIMQGNSLLESFEGIDLSQISDAAAYEAVYESQQIGLFSGERKKKVSISSLKYEDIKSLMEDYFNASDSETKKNLHKRIDEQVFNHIRFTLAEHKKDLQKKAKKLEKKISLDEAAARTWEQKEKIKTNSKAAKALVKFNNELSQYNDKEIKLAQLSNSNERPFFLWHLFFQEVFENGGFDIVIGNPPYVEFKKVSTREKNSYVNYMTAKGKYDIFCLFIELSNNLLKKDGIHCYINPTTFMMKDFGKSLRELINNYFKIIEVFDFSDYQIFPTAITYTGIFLFKKQFNSNKHSYNFRYQKLNGSSQISNSELLFTDFKANIFKEFNWIDSEELYNLSWVFNNPFDKKILNKLRSGSVELGEITKYTFQGIASGKDEVFYIDKNVISKYSLEREIIYPIFKGKDINKYTANWSGKYVIYPYSKKDNSLIGELELQDSYPNIYKYLLHNKNKLSGRGYFDKSSKLWYELWCERKYHKFNQLKIVNAEISPENRFYLDSENTLGNTKVFSTVMKDNISEYTIAMLGILNSTLMNYYHKKIASQKAGGFYDYKTQFIKKYPIKLPQDKSHLEASVHKIIEHKSKGIDTSKYELDVDTYVFKLYQLTYEEACYIAPKIKIFWRKEEYENVFNKIKTIDCEF